MIIIEYIIFFFQTLKQTIPGYLSVLHCKLSSMNHNPCFFIKFFLSPIMSNIEKMINCWHANFFGVKIQTTRNYNCN